MRKERIMKYYCGPKKRKKYFEGWYFKHASRDLKSPSFRAFLFWMGKEGICSSDQQSFSDCFEFPPEDFSADDESLSIKIGNNHFSERGININLTNPKHEIKADLKYSELLIPKNIMGPFKYFPKMECVHSIFSMKHSVYGSISLNGREYFFYDDLGYMKATAAHLFRKNMYGSRETIFRTGHFPFDRNHSPRPVHHGTDRFALCGYERIRFATYNNTKIIKNAEEHIRLKKESFVGCVHQIG